MLTGALFSGYTLGVGAIMYNITRTKMQDDFENEIRKLREFDFGHETINSEKDLPINCIMLAKYVPEDNQHIPSKEPKIKVGLDEKPPVQNDLIFSRVLSYSVLLDPTKYVKVRSSVLQEYGLKIIKFSINSEKGMALR